MTRDQLIETMARAICAYQGEIENYSKFYKGDATAALTAIEAAGMRVVPVEMMHAIREETAAVLERYDDQEQSNHPHVYVLLQRIAAFLATMEKPNDP